MDAVLNEELVTVEAGILHHEAGIDLMPANIELSGVETSLIGIMSSETILKEYIEMIGPRYDYVIIDCSPNLAIKGHMVIKTFLIITIATFYFTIMSRCSWANTFVFNFKFVTQDIQWMRAIGLLKMRKLSTVVCL